MGLQMVAVEEGTDGVLLCHFSSNLEEMNATFLRRSRFLGSHCYCHCVFVRTVNALL